MLAASPPRIPTPRIRFGDNGAAAPDSSPQSFPGYGKKDVARPIVRKRMPGWQIWQGPETGEGVLEH